MTRPHRERQRTRRLDSSPAESESFPRHPQALLNVTAPKLFKPSKRASVGEAEDGEVDRYKQQRHRNEYRNEAHEA
ncbi:hypothetical protein N780_03260 [Pontibacillus chungwhensis BH030062]|uniref:Uncharacterized protein n=1 Tax=Pontibacillus chungwhensis BH030062 TaxID=1385513 RepID=A0A0A2UVN4_9BACI|nr:hypothetical protein N780_03260 [Pontibacillus chungwhensis BH030062]